MQSLNVSISTINYDQYGMYKMTAGQNFIHSVPI